MALKMISWNVNGFRSILNKGFMEIFRALDADLFCLQEIKLQAGQHEADFEGCHEYWHYAEKKGYSGTAVIAKEAAIGTSFGIGVERLDKEGRVLTLEYPGFFLVNCYTPNSQDGLARLDYRQDWDAAFREYLGGLKSRKPVVVCGDLNVAHQEIDLKNPKTNRMNAGFTDQERAGFSSLLASGFAETFRRQCPDRADAYSWWSYRFQARERNVGWRIDYFLTSEDIMPQVIESSILPEIHGSDHCPVMLLLGGG